mmetsp:Transcript_21462/g.48474  ORF Transcript_21462/g.48474 Transcript_21462/m.48474 type:complete len:203 (-) Transcript_21462:1117-1725(-)
MFVHQKMHLAIGPRIPSIHVHGTILPLLDRRRRQERLLMNLVQRRHRRLLLLLMLLRLIQGRHGLSVQHRGLAEIRLRRRRGEEPRELHGRETVLLLLRLAVRNKIGQLLRKLLLCEDLPVVQGDGHLLAVLDVKIEVAHEEFQYLGTGAPRALVGLEQDEDGVHELLLLGCSVRLEKNHPHGHHCVDDGRRRIGGYVLAQN